MCGRFAAALDYSQLAARFHARPAQGLPAASWNISPGSQIAIIAQDARGVRHLNPATWNLVPTWSPTDRMDYPTHNARVETATDKRTYSEAARSHRAIIPATGYYEWDGDHRPFYFSSPEGGPLLLAGLYSWWRADEGSAWKLTATILTTRAEGGAARVHDRMPVLLDDDLCDDWLDPQVDGGTILPRAAGAGARLSTRLSMRQVAPVKGDGPDLIEPIALRY
ncbi:SOS response-associated peptidase [Bifidobacterium favimelis]|uniref:Abasic site processing protein n=1 Tax=Bifidobacterium favimelis TaxID=3122979 RepID=A0ABU8ZPL7_9BIFI